MSPTLTIDTHAIELPADTTYSPQPLTPPTPSPKAYIDKPTMQDLVTTDLVELGIYPVPDDTSSSTDSLEHDDDESIEELEVRRESRFKERLSDSSSVASYADEPTSPYMCVKRAESQTLMKVAPKEVTVKGRTPKQPKRNKPSKPASETTRSKPAEGGKTNEKPKRRDLLSRLRLPLSKKPEKQGKAVVATQLTKIPLDSRPAVLEAAAKPILQVCKIHPLMVPDFEMYPGEGARDNRFWLSASVSTGNMSSCIPMSKVPEFVEPFDNNGVKQVVMPLFVVGTEVEGERTGMGKVVRMEICVDIVSESFAKSLNGFDMVLGWNALAHMQSCWGVDGLIVEDDGVKVSVKTGYAAIE